MRWLAALLFPLAIQLFLYAIVFFAARGGGSFMGLFAMPVAAVTVLIVLARGIVRAQGSQPLGGIFLGQLGLAIIPPILLLILRALES